MNYVWEALLKIRERGQDKRDIRHKPAIAPSPYMELSFEDINETDPDETKLYVNPLYRFGEIFGEIFAPDMYEYPMTRELFLDVYMHYAADSDLLSGLHRKEYRYLILEREIMRGTMGKSAMEAVRLFTGNARRVILTALIHTCESGYYRENFVRLVRRLYENSIIYAANDRSDAIYVYIGCRDTERERRKVGFLVDSFLTVGEDVKIFYDKHFGIPDVDETMWMDRMVLV